MRILSGVAIGSILFMVHLISKHGTQNGMAQMIVALIACQVGEQVLNGMIDMFLRRNAFVVSVP